MSNKNDPAMAEAIARAAESRAQILRSKAASNLAYAKMADKAERDAKNASRRLAGLPEVHPGPEGTAQHLADSEGNFAANAQVAATGGIGIDASNTNVASGQPAQTPEQAGIATTPGAQKVIGDQVVGGAASSRMPETDATRAAVAIPEGWRDLSWQERRSIASKVSDDPISNGEEANAAIEAELKRRGGK